GDAVGIGACDGLAMGVDGGEEALVGADEAVEDRLEGFGAAFGGGGLRGRPGGPAVGSLGCGVVLWRPGHFASPTHGVVCAPVRRLASPVPLARPAGIARRA